MKKFITSLFAFMLTIYVSGAVYNIGTTKSIMTMVFTLKFTSATLSGSIQLLL